MTGVAHELISFVHLMPPVAIEFFATFSRAEYALKRNGLCFMSGPQLVVDWDTFADAVPLIIVTANQEQKAQTLLSAPPKRQAVQNGALAWHDVPPVGSDVRALFRALRRVRNNLFHGGKFHADMNTDTSRSVNLLDDGLWLIYRAIDMHPNQSIAATFRELS